MFNLKSTLLAGALVLATGTVAHAQYSPYQQGLRDGGRNGYYDHGNYDRHHYDNRGDYDNRYHQGGIGPGKGAAIGAGGGALLGGLLGGGLKGALIGGGVGAGIGAIVGKEHQNNQRRNDGYYPR